VVASGMSTTPDVQLFCGDCLEILPTLGRADAVVTDPPYGMEWNTDSKRFCGGKSPKIIRNREVARGKSPGRADWGEVGGDRRPFDPSLWLGFPKVVLWGANHYAAALPVGTTLIWVKKPDELFGTFLSDADVGWQKGGQGVYCFRRTFTGRTRAKEAWGTAGYDLPPAHPTQKPVGLMEWCIRRLKLTPGSTVLDPYMGSGTTGVAAVRLGFNFIGLEIDPTYYAVAERRIAAALASTPLFDRPASLPAPAPARAAVPTLFD
jgi:site-specific DNA-methyltransferase (adenine-specific)